VQSLPRGLQEGGKLAGLRIEHLSIHHVGPIDLELAAGECVCISGPSGAGKTLLLRALADLDPHEGEVWLDGCACSSMPGPLWRRRVGYLPAESHWWAETVAEHLPAVPDQAALEALGFEYGILQQPVRRLSSGERQRLALLRLLANRPWALLLDEPTAALDPVNMQGVENLVNRYRRQHRAAVLWVSHDEAQIARLAARHYRLSAGRLQPAVEVL